MRPTGVRVASQGSPNEIRNRRHDDAALAVLNLALLVVETTSPRHLVPRTEHSVVQPQQCSDRAFVELKLKLSVDSPCPVR